MSTNFVLALGCQSAALILLFRVLRRRWLSHVGAVFLVLATVYHGLGEILVRLFPGRNLNRLFVTQEAVDRFLVPLSAAILLATVAYLVTLRFRARSRCEPDETDRHRVAHFYDWRLMLILAAPLVVLTVRGNGLVATGDIVDPTARASSVTSGLAAQFLLLAVPLAAFSLIDRFGPRWLSVALIVQSALIAAVGQRTNVVIAGLILIYGLARYGVRLSRRQLLAGAGVVVLISLFITSARAHEGRTVFAGGGESVKLGTVVSGGAHLFSPETVDAIKTTLGYRLDGNSFGAQEAEAIRSGYPPEGVAPIRHDLALAVPSFLNHNKLSSDPAQRTEKLYAEYHFGLRVTDILATQIGASVGYFGVPGMFIIAAFFGMALGLLDAWIARGAGPARLIVGLGAMYAATNYARTYDVWTITARGVAVVLVVVLGAQLARHFVTQPRRSAVIRELV